MSEEPVDDNSIEMDFLIANGTAAAAAVNAGLHPCRVLALMEQCCEEMRELVKLVPPEEKEASATQIALARMKESGATSLEDLQQFMADAGATVIISDEHGTRQIEPSGT